MVIDVICREERCPNPYAALGHKYGINAIRIHLVVELEPLAVSFQIVGAVPQRLCSVGHDGHTLTQLANVDLPTLVQEIGPQHHNHLEKSHSTSLLHFHANQFERLFCLAPWVNTCALFLSRCA